MKSPRYGTQSITQSTSSTRRKGDSKCDTLTGFQQPAGTQQPMETILATGFVFFFYHKLENNKSLMYMLCWRRFCAENVMSHLETLLQVFLTQIKCGMRTLKPFRLQK